MALKKGRVAKSSRPVREPARQKPIRGASPARGTSPARGASPARSASPARGASLARAASPIRFVRSAASSEAARPAKRTARSWWASAADAALLCFLVVAALAVLRILFRGVFALSLLLFRRFPTHPLVRLLGVWVDSSEGSEPIWGIAYVFWQEGPHYPVVYANLVLLLGGLFARASRHAERA